MYNKALKKTLIILLLIITGTIQLRAQIKLKESSKALGINQVNVNPELLGGGVAVIDINNDGFQDLYFNGGFYQDELFLNVQGEYFERISKASGVFDITRTIRTTAVAVGDINNDGLSDLFISTGRDLPGILLLNQGNDTFQDISSMAGITQNAWNMGAAFLDVNRDGFSDIYVINYIKNGSAIQDENGTVIGFDHACSNNFLYINNGDNTFSEMAESYGVADAGCGLAILAMDLNNDQLIDLLVINDFGEWVQPNAAYINQFPNPLFINKAVEMGLDTHIYGMGVGHGDYDQDGDTDFYMTNIGENKFLKNEEGIFTDISRQTGTASDLYDSLFSAGWGAVFWDADNDAKTELFLANGFIPAADFIKTNRIDPDRLYTYEGNDSFVEVDGFSGYPGISRGVVVADLNLDGKQDLVVSVSQRFLQDTAHARIYLNESEQTGNWISVLLTGSASGRDAIGAVAKGYINETMQRQVLAPAGSHASQSSSQLHFSLGLNENIDSLEIYWPSGLVEMFFDLPGNKHYRLVENTGQALLLGCDDPKALNYDPDVIGRFGCRYDMLLSAGEEKTSQNIIVYPNPAGQYVRLQGSANAKFQLTILDASGKPVLAQSDVREKEDIDVSALAPGIYFIRLQSTNHQEVAPLIISR